MIGVILAAGDGKRLKKSSNEECCKPLIKINNKKLIEYSLDNLLKLHIEQAFIVIGKEGKLIQQALGDEYKKIKLHYVYQAEQKGLMHAFVQALHSISCNTDIVLQLADEIFVDMHLGLIKTTIDTKAYDFYCGITIESDFDKIRTNYSVDTNADSEIKKCTEKPKMQINNIKGTGFCIFTDKAIKLLLAKYNAETNAPCDLCDYINWLIEENNTGLALEIAEKEFNINTFMDLVDAERYFDNCQ